MLTVRRLSPTHQIFSHRTVAVLLFVATVCGGNLAGWSQGVPSQTLVDLIAQRKIIPAGQSVKALVSPTQATVTTERGQKDDDRACKLRAILIAKCVFESQPSTIQKAVVVFLDYQTNAANTATIKRAEVNEFGAGRLDEEGFLASIDFDKQQASGSEESSVVQGDMQTQREILLARITRMKTQGTNVNAFMNIFKETEQLAQSGDQAKLKDRVEYLSDKISEQEAAIKAAKTRVSTTTVAAHNGCAVGLTPTLSAALTEAGLDMACEPIGKFREVLLLTNDRNNLSVLDNAIMRKDRDSILRILGTYEQHHH